MDAIRNEHLRQRAATPDEKNEFFNDIFHRYWGQGATNLRDGVAGVIERARQARRKNPKEAIDVVFVLTDGEETHAIGPTVREQVEAAGKEGILVVGVGIGGGMDTVRREFPVHLVESNPLELPALISEFIKRFVASSAERP
ncbi:MAG: VWA domain-containing protein [Pseudomonadota bacterium]